MGDYNGHPFRGNQYSKGKGSGMGFGQKFTDAAKSTGKFVAEHPVLVAEGVVGTIAVAHGVSKSRYFYKGITNHPNFALTGLSKKQAAYFSAGAGAKTTYHDFYKMMKKPFPGTS